MLHARHLSLPFFALLLENPPFHSRLSNLEAIFGTISLTNLDSKTVAIGKTAEFTSADGIAGESRPSLSTLDDGATRLELGVHFWWDRSKMTTQ